MSKTCAILALMWLNFLSLAFKEREEAAFEDEEFLRDVEYYALGVYAGVSGNTELTTYIGFAPVYDLMKQLAFAFKKQGYLQMEYFLRADKTRPITEPGWRLDAWRGMREGWFGAPLRNRKMRLP